MTLLDTAGNLVIGKESIMDLALSGDKLASLKRDGLKTVATLNAPPGLYQVRTVVREGMQGSPPRQPPQSNYARSEPAGIDNEPGPMARIFYTSGFFHRSP
jgi:hypothetical protein